MIRQCMRLAGRLALAAGVLLAWFALIEFLRGYQLFRGIHPGLGFLYLLFSGALAAGLTLWLAGSWLALGRPLIPPRLPADLDEAPFPQLLRYCRFLIRLLQRLSANPNLDGRDREQAAEAAAELRETLRHHPLRDDLQRAIEESAGAARALLGRLKKRADEEISRGVRDVMLGVTLSPYHSVDLLIVLYRNGLMILRIARLFHARPAAREQWLILRDTLRVVAAVNILNLSRTLIQSLFDHVPVLGRVADDIAQGLGAGLMTSAAGHAAAERCAALDPWDSAAHARTLAARAGDYFRDVRDLFTRDILPQLRPRLRAGGAAVPAAEGAGDEAASWDDRIGAGIAAAVDATLRVCQDSFLRPAAAGSRHVARAGRSLTRGFFRGAGALQRRAADRWRHFRRRTRRDA